MRPAVLRSNASFVNNNTPNNNKSSSNNNSNNGSNTVQRGVPRHFSGNYGASPGSVVTSAASSFNSNNNNNNTSAHCRSNSFTGSQTSGGRVVSSRDSSYNKINNNNNNNSNTRSNHYARCNSFNGAQASANAPRVGGSVSISSDSSYGKINNSNNNVRSNQYARSNSFTGSQASANSNNNNSSSNSNNNRSSSYARSNSFTGSQASANGSVIGPSPRGVTISGGAVVRRSITGATSIAQSPAGSVSSASAKSITWKPNPLPPLNHQPPIYSGANSSNSSAALSGRIRGNVVGQAASSMTPRVSPPPPLSSATSVSSSVKTGANGDATHVWVQTDLVDALVKYNGELPKGWKPRKRARSLDVTNWGWCRAHMYSKATSNTYSNSGGAAPSTAAPTTPDRNNKPPFQSVKLRKVNSPVPPSAATNKIAAAPPSWRGSPDRKTTIVSVTLTVDDEEFAPPHLQHVTVNFKYNPADVSQVCTANAWWHDSSNEPPQDLCQLEQLHEPAVVYCLLRRYQWDKIYTYTGKILLALNPFKILENVYEYHVMEQYWQQNAHDDADADVQRPPPHIYAVAADAYRSMMRASFDRDISGKPKNQSILVSGESGAGKTVTTKIIMRYLATLSQRSNADGKASIESQVLQSNPILESFGNARTVRNDNSSRFGKFIEIQFQQSGCLVSATIETYLLEKIRLIFQAPGERNYHIFYELLAGLPQKERADLKVANMTASDFRMTAVSGTFDRRDSVDDRDSFKDLRNALDTVGFSRVEQHDLFTVACALLHASNLSFRDLGNSSAHDDDACELDQSNTSFKAAVALLGVDVTALNEALCRVTIEARGEILYKNMSVRQAQKAAEALIKITYGALFTYIVRRVNGSIGTRADILSETVQLDGSVPATASIGVLDIFGFESFDVNSFEQLCINYCNEALQQQFNRFVFKLEQQVYQKEGIEWSFISFPDNQDVLDLIEKKHEGIISVLDEQSRLPRCTDVTFARSVYDKCGDHPRFEATRTQQGELTFSIQHYAGLVEYDTTGFLEKNKDELPKETIELLKSSDHSLVAFLGRDLEDASSPATSSNASRPPFVQKKQLNRSGSLVRDSVGTQFSSQLRELRTRIESTEPHYVRCLKPNDDLVPNQFNALVIADQLRCAGVLEAIRVSRVGFPHRYNHDHFVQRYFILGRSALQRTVRHCTSASQVCEALVEHLIPLLTQEFDGESELFSVPSQAGKRPVFLGLQLGRSKVFLRRRAFEALEHLRSKFLDDSATKIQSCIRMYMAKIDYEITIYAVIVIQNLFRRVGACRHVREQRILHSAGVIQRQWRGYTARKIYWAAESIAWWCQSTYRGSIARQYCAYLFLNRKVAVIQNAWKRYKSHRSGVNVKSCVISFQTLFRAKRAKRELCRLRQEARDLSAIAAERDKYREESLRLKQQLEEEKKKASTPVNVVPNLEREVKQEEVNLLRHEVERLQSELERAHRMSTASQSHASEVQLLMEELQRKEDDLELLKNELFNLRSKSDSFSVKSFTIETSAPGVFRGQSAFRTSPRTPPKKRSSPVRSDISLLDTEDDGPHIAEEHVKTAQRLFADDEFLPSPAILAKQMSEVNSDRELQHLHNAIRQGNRALFDQVLRQTTEVCLLINQGDKYGRTALHLAALGMRVDMAEHLINKGAVVNAQDDDGETPLHLAENVGVTILLLKQGRANPNIPNVDGICPLHLAVQRRDVESVRALLRGGAKVNNADNVRWFTPLHLICLPARSELDNRTESGARGRIAQLLTSSHGPVQPDLNYQDSEGNSPLHYCVQLDQYEACALVKIFLERGANPNISNDRNQSPLHLLCHNSSLRRKGLIHEILHSMLFYGANPNQQSLTGCTPLHLSLYHKDVDSAVQLVFHGAELHVRWKKPKKWPSFWDDRGLPEVLALDMVDEPDDLHRILSAINRPLVKFAPPRSWCMQCKTDIGTCARALHCRHCGRLICENCSSCCIPGAYFPKSFEIMDSAWVCSPCEGILTLRNGDPLINTPPTSSYDEEIYLPHERDNNQLFSC